MNLFVMRTIYLIFIFMYTLNMSDLERVLTYLMEQGWKPWDKDVDKIVVCPKEEFADGRNLFIEVFFSNGFSTYRSFRELVSLESGLRQFVVEKRLFERNLNVWTNHGMQREYDIYDHTYWVIESALCIEEDLSEFLVNSIIVSDE